MKYKSRISYLALMAVIILTVFSCKPTTKVCLLDRMENQLSGDVFTCNYDDQDRLIGFSDYDANGNLQLRYVIYYQNDGQIEHIDAVLPFNIVAERFQVVFDYDGSVGSVYYLYDGDQDGNPTNIYGHHELDYDINGEIDKVYRYNSTNVLQQTYDLTFENGNLIYATEVGSNEESYYTYDDKKGGRTQLGDFYKIIIPSIPLVSKNNLLQADNFVGGVLNSTTTYAISYNSDGLAETIDDETFFYNCEDRN